MEVLNLLEFCFLSFSRSILRFRASNFAGKHLVFIIKSAREETVYYRMRRTTG